MVTRNDALVNSLTVYDECKPCFKGHPPIRYSLTGKCVHCHREASKRDKVKVKCKGTMRRLYGLVPFKAFVHLDDIENVEAFCTALRLDRDIPIELG